MFASLLRVVRIVLAVGAMLGFITGGPLIGLLLLPALRLFSRDRSEYRRCSTRVLSRLHAFFLWTLRGAGLVRGPERYPTIPGIAPGQPFVLLSNHPTLIDAIFLLGGYRDLTCVVNRRWYRTLALGALLRQSAYLPGPRHDGGAEPGDDVLAAMVRHLESGHPLLVFPEGERSLPDRLRRFRRGAVEAAVRARVPVVALYLSTDRPFLTKGDALSTVAEGPARYAIELLAVVDTRTLPIADARALNADLHARYSARFARTLAERAVGGSPRPRSFRAPLGRAGERAGSS